MCARLYSRLLLCIASLIVHNGFWTKCYYYSHCIDAETEGGDKPCLQD